MGIDLSFFYPPICAACDKVGKALCDECALRLHFVGDRLCDICGQPVVNAGLCGDCRLERPPFVTHRSLFKFEDVVARLIHELKYQHGFWVTDFLFSLVTLEKFPVDLIMPTPLFKKRLRSRGYNQSALIADELGRRFAVYVDKRTLVRVKDTPTQTALSRDERRTNLTDAFWVRDESAIRDKKILLVDDVFTTGATLSSAAKTLLMAGASEVHAFTFAMTVKAGVIS